MTENATRNPIASLASEAFAHEYARLLQDSGDVSRDLAWAESYLASARAGLGDKPVAWSSEPVFVDGNGLERLETFSNIAYSVLDKALRAFRSNGDFRALFGMDAATERLCCLDTGYECQAPIVRFDIAFDDGGAAHLFNVATAAARGVVGADEVARAWRRSSIFTEFERRHQTLSAFDLTEACVDSVLDVYRAWAGPGFPDTNPGDDYTYGDETMSLSIVGDRANTDMNEIERFITLFRDRGVHARFADVSELSIREVRPGRVRLVDGDGPIACVWRRVDLGRILEIGGAGLDALVQAAERNVACLVGGMRTWPLASPQFVSALTSEAFSRELSPSELELVRGFASWSEAAEHGCDTLSVFVFNGHFAGISVETDGLRRPCYLV